MTASQRAREPGAARRAGVACLGWAALLSLCSVCACDDGSPDRDVGDGGVDARSPGAGDGSVDAMVDAAQREPEVLTHNALWKVVDAADDPFEDRPEQVSCPETALGEEPFGGLLTFFVDSAKCDYATVSQPSRAPVRIGDEVVVRFKHFPLTGPDGGTAEAHLAFMLGEVLIAERTVPIPAGDREYEITWTATRDVAEDTPVYFHAHNHGQNEYSVLDLEVVPGE